eukprot:jgi/Mesvir1/524/Mv11386-RA.1
MPVWSFPNLQGDIPESERRSAEARSFRVWEPKDSEREEVDPAEVILEDADSDVELEPEDEAEEGGLEGGPGRAEAEEGGLEGGPGRAKGGKKKKEPPLEDIFVELAKLVFVNKTDYAEAAQHLAHYTMADATKQRYGGAEGGYTAYVNEKGEDGKVHSIRQPEGGIMGTTSWHLLGYLLYLAAAGATHSVLDMAYKGVANSMKTWRTQWKQKYPGVRHPQIVEFGQDTMTPEIRALLIASKRRQAMRETEDGGNYQRDSISGYPTREQEEKFFDYLLKKAVKAPRGYAQFFAFQTMCMWLFQCATFLRGDNTRRLRLSQMFTTLYEDIKPTVANLVGVVMKDGKTNKNGWKTYAGMIMAKNLLRCPVVMLSMCFYWRWNILREAFPMVELDESTEGEEIAKKRRIDRVWKKILVFIGRKTDNPQNRKTHHSRFREALDHAGVATHKTTHGPRGLGAWRCRRAGATMDSVMRAGGWNLTHVVISYLRDWPWDVLLAAAGFKPRASESESVYSIKEALALKEITSAQRDQAVKELWPDLDAAKQQLDQLNEMRDATDQEVDMQKFYECLEGPLTDAILIGAPLWKQAYPDLPLWTHGFFTSKTFKDIEEIVLRVHNMPGTSFQASDCSECGRQFHGMGEHIRELTLTLQQHISKVAEKDAEISLLRKELAEAKEQLAIARAKLEAGHVSSNGWRKQQRVGGATERKTPNASHHRAQGTHSVGGGATVGVGQGQPDKVDEAPSHDWVCPLCDGSNPDFVYPFSVVNNCLERAEECNKSKQFGRLKLPPLWHFLHVHGNDGTKWRGTNWKNVMWLFRAIEHGYMANEHGEVQPCVNINDPEARAVEVATHWEMMRSKLKLNMTKLCAYIGTKAPKFGDYQIRAGRKNVRSTTAQDKGNTVSGGGDSGDKGVTHRLLILYRC